MSANHWPPKDWEILLEDTDCLYGRDLGNGRFHFIEVTDMPDACGSDWTEPYQFVIELCEVDIASLSARTLKGVREFVGGDEEEWTKSSDLGRAETCHSYGCKAPLGSEKARTGYQTAVRRMAKLSADIAENPAVHACYMNAQVNAVGSTAREYMQGDIDSALKRMDAPPPGQCGSPSDAVVESLPPFGDALRRNVRQNDLSDECFFVQVWGLGYCKACEYRQTPDCGGTEIRRTGKNSKGHRVPVGEPHE